MNTKNLLTYSLIGCIVFLLLAVSVLLFTLNFSKLESAGVVGDAFGGLLNPVVAFIGVIAAGAAFWAQYEANQQLIKDRSFDKFESIIFKLIDDYYDKNHLTVNEYQSFLNQLKLYYAIARYAPYYPSGARFLWASEDNAENIDVNICNAVDRFLFNKTQVSPSGEIKDRIERRFSYIQDAGDPIDFHLDSKSVIRLRLPFSIGPFVSHFFPSINKLSLIESELGQGIRRGIISREEALRYVAILGSNMIREERILLAYLIRRGSWALNRYDFLVWLNENDTFVSALFDDVSTTDQDLEVATHRVR